MRFKYGTNIIESKFNGKQKFYLLSDLHWDNPKCDLVYLKSVFEKAKAENARVGINGDLFCLMQGRYDGRSIKSDIRPEHNTATYLDSVIKDAVSWFTPYAGNLDFIGYGNHETSIIKNLETDPIERFITSLNLMTGERVHKGGYNGWWILRGEKNGSKYTHKIHYRHGWGGGGPVSKSMIKFHRIATKLNNYDAMWIGHIHDLVLDYHNTEEILFHPKKGYYVSQKIVYNVCTPSFKNEFVDGAMGFQNYSNNANKPIGYVELTLDALHDRLDVEYQAKVKK